MKDSVKDFHACRDSVRPWQLFSKIKSMQLDAAWILKFSVHDCPLFPRMVHLCGVSGHFKRSSLDGCEH
ncbi:MAG: hypothetical protein R3Y58_12480, partial [Eubacteriales bacterium]